MANKTYCNLTDEIFDDVNVECNVAEGFEDVAIFIKRSDIDMATIITENSTKYPNNIVLVHSGATGTLIKADKETAIVMQLKNPFSGTSTEFAEGDYRNTVTNTVSLNVWSTDPKAGATLDAMLNGDYVAIIPQKYEGDADNSVIAGGAHYRVFGIQQGLKCTGMSNDPYSDTLGNGWTVTFTEEGATASCKFLMKAGEDDATPDVTATENLLYTLSKGKLGKQA